MNILVNYLYELYPFTTASYYEMAIKKSSSHFCFRNTKYNPDKIDLVLNIEPVADIIKIPGVPSVYYEIDNHVIMGNDHHWYEQVDMVLLAQKYFKDYYYRYKTEYLPLACWPDVHKRYKEEKQIYDIGFLGNDTYPHRRQLLETLKQNFKVLWDTSKPGELYSRKLNQCKMLFNCHMNHDVNMRFFEAISSGRLLLTDYLIEQDEFAESGKHYSAFYGADDLVQKVKYYLKHTKKREYIAYKGMKHVQKYSSYQNRLEQLLCIIKHLGS